jgi:hypothetical protein
MKFKIPKSAEIEAWGVSLNCSRPPNKTINFNMGDVDKSG